MSQPTHLSGVLPEQSGKEDRNLIYELSINFLRNYVNIDQFSECFFHYDEKLPLTSA